MLREVAASVTLGAALVGGFLLSAIGSLLRVGWISDSGNFMLGAFFLFTGLGIFLWPSASVRWLRFPGRNPSFDWQHTRLKDRLIWYAHGLMYAMIGAAIVFAVLFLD